MTVTPIIQVTDLNKIYATGFTALKSVNLEIHRGEIFALLGPNGAGKTTLISIICGIVNPSSGKILADGCDIISDYRAARSRIGLVPQELHTDAFESVWDTVTFSRGRPVKSCASLRTIAGCWVGAHIVQVPSFTWAVIAIGSMHAWAKYGA